MRRRRLGLILVFLILGAAVNVLMAWSCACLANPKAFDPLLLARIRREFFARDTPQQQHFVDMAYAGFGAQFIMVLIESPSIQRDPINGPYPAIGVIRAGWPALALEGRLYYDASRSPTPSLSRPSWSVMTSRPAITGNRICLPVMLPLRPLWPGFASNSVLYAIGLWLIWRIPIWLRRLIRRIRNRCTRCGYPVGVSEACSECGHRVGPRGSVGGDTEAKLSA